MSKKACSFRLDENAVFRLEKLLGFYNKNLPWLTDSSASFPMSSSGVKKTDIVEFLINQRYETLKNEGYDI